MTGESEHRAAPREPGRTRPSVSGRRRTGSHEALRELIRLLDDADPDVRRGAHVALARIAALPLPPERAVWERWLADASFGSPAAPRAAPPPRALP